MGYQIHTEDHDDGPAWSYTMKPERNYNEQWFQYPEGE